jgi:hypothetical protein
MPKFKFKVAATRHCQRDQSQRGREWGHIAEVRKLELIAIDGNPPFPGGRPMGAHRNQNRRRRHGFDT